MQQQSKDYYHCFDYDATNLAEYISVGLLTALTLALLIFVANNINRIKIWLAQYPLSNPNKLYCTNSCLVLLLSFKIINYVAAFLNYPTPITDTPDLSW